MRHLLLAAAALIAAPGIVCADQTTNNSPPPTYSQPHFGFSVASGFEFGGSKLATGFFDNGDSANITGGRGLVIELGGNYRPSKSSPWDISLTGGYKFNEVGGTSGGSLTFNHVVFELIGSYQWNNSVFMGAGPVYHGATSLTGDGYFPDVRFQAAAGGQVQVGWRCIALTYTVVRYQDDFGYSANGNNVGLRFIGNF